MQRSRLPAGGANIFQKIRAKRAEAAGVGPVVRGDVMVGHIGGLGDLTVKVV